MMDRSQGRNSRVLPAGFLVGLWLASSPKYSRTICLGNGAVQDKDSSRIERPNTHNFTARILLPHSMSSHKSVCVYV